MVMILDPSGGNGHTHDEWPYVNGLIVCLGLFACLLEREVLPRCFLHRHKFFEDVGIVE